MRGTFRFPQPIQETSVPVYAGDHWAACPDCGDLNELAAAFWEAVELAGCQEAPVRCQSCGRLFTVSVWTEASLEP